MYAVNMPLVASIRVVGVNAANPLDAAKAAYDSVKDSLSEILQKSFPLDPNLQGCQVECVSWAGMDIESATVEIAWENGDELAPVNEVANFELDNGHFVA